MDVREKLIEILRKPIFPHELVDPTEAVADYLLDSGVTVQEWISVDDRLPEDDEQIESYYDGRMSCKTVLVYTKYGIIIQKNRLIVRPTGNKYLDDQVTDGWIWSGGTEEVTHWMPMPNPPKMTRHTCGTCRYYDPVSNVCFFCAEVQPYGNYYLVDTDEEACSEYASKENAE